MSKKKFEFNDKQSKDWLKGLLREEIVEITFTKKDGSERKMKCTLSDKKIPSAKMPKTESKAKNDDALPVFDLEKESWRSFRWDSIKQIEFSLGK